MIPLSPELLGRLDETPDAFFYAEPRFVTHVDDAATQRYASTFPRRASSWTS